MSAASGSSDDSKQVLETANALAVGQMAKQLSGRTRHSDISVESTRSVDYSSLIPLRDRLVGPDIFAVSRSCRRSRPMLSTSCLIGMVLAGGTSAFIAFREFSLADIWAQMTTRGEQTIPRLIVQSSRGSEGEPIPLGLTIHGPAEGAVIIITGLLPGMELSNGIEVDVDRWEVPARDVSYTWIVPPDGFVGSAALTAELRLTDNSIAYRRAMHLEWVPSSAPGSETAAPTSPVLASERDLEKTAAMPASPSVATEGDRQEVTVSSSSPVSAGAGDSEKAAAIASSSPLASEGDRQQATVSSNSPVLAGERDSEKSVAIPVSPSPAPEGDRKQATVSSGPPVVVGERDREKTAARLSSPPLAPGQLGREEAVLRPIPSTAQKQVDREQPVAGSSLPATAQRQLDREEFDVLLKRGKDLIGS